MCTVLLFSVLSASVASHADSNVFNRRPNSLGIVADVNDRQKIFGEPGEDTTSESDRLRAELAGKKDAQRRGFAPKTGVSGAAKEILTLMGAYFPRFLP